MKSLHRFIVAVASAAFFVASPAVAQWQAPDHSVPIGRGAGATGFKSVSPSTSGLPLVSQGASSDPVFGAFGTNAMPAFGSGDVSFASGGGAATIANNAVTNGKLAQMPTNTVKCNSTGSTANAQDCVSPVASTLTLNGSNSTDALNITQNLNAAAKYGISITQAITGSMGGGFNHNLINITSDNSQCVGAVFCNGFTTQYLFGGSAMTGGRQGAQVSATLTAPTSASNPNRNYVAGTFIADAQSSDNGTNTGAGAQGAMFSMNPVAKLSAGATNWLELSGGEVDIGMDSTASTKYMIGWSIVGGYQGGQNGAGTATAMGAGVSVSAVVPQTFDAAYIITDLNSGWPIKTSGTLQRAFITGSTPTVANGTDWSAVTFSGFAFKSNGFSVNGAGVVHAAGLDLALSGTGSATAGAASALPSLPSAYITIQINGTNFKIPIYNP